MADVVIVGAGPAGLSCATELSRRGIDVTVIDRDESPGGVPRYTDHLGYGLSDLRVLSGPSYARRLVDRAMATGVELRSLSTATDVTADASHAAVEVTSPLGRTTMSARAVVLATGCRERPRAARLIPGARPPGIYTTAWLQRATMNGTFRGTRAVIVGAEHVSYSAVLTLAHVGCRTVAMVTESARHQTYAPVDLASRLRYRFPLMTGTRIVDVVGPHHLSGVVVQGPKGEQSLACDTLIVSGDWIAENELARRAGLATGERGAIVTDGFRTENPRIFAAGNVMHPARTADACAREGTMAARSVLQWLDTPAAEFSLP